MILLFNLMSKFPIKCNLIEYICLDACDMISHQIIWNAKLQIVSSHFNSNGFKAGFYFPSIAISISLSFFFKTAMHFNIVFSLSSSVFMHFCNICLHKLAYLWLYCGWFVRYIAFHRYNTYYVDFYLFCCAISFVFAFGLRSIFNMI